MDRYWSTPPPWKVPPAPRNHPRRQNSGPTPAGPVESGRRNSRATPPVARARGRSCADRRHSIRWLSARDTTGNAAAGRGRFRHGLRWICSRAQCHHPAAATTIPLKEQATAHGQNRGMESRCRRGRPPETRTRRAFNLFNLRRILKLAPVDPGCRGRTGRWFPPKPRTISHT